MYLVHCSIPPHVRRRTLENLLRQRSLTSTAVVSQLHIQHVHSWFQNQHLLLEYGEGSSFGHKICRLSFKRMIVASCLVSASLQIGRGCSPLDETRLSHTLIPHRNYLESQGSRVTLTLIHCAVLHGYHDALTCTSSTIPKSEGFPNKGMHYGRKHYPVRFLCRSALYFVASGIGSHIRCPVPACAWSSKRTLF